MRRLVVALGLGLFMGGVALAQEKTPAPKPPETKPPETKPSEAPAETLDQLEERYRTLDLAEQPFWDAMNDFAIESRELMKFMGVEQEAAEKAAKDPTNKNLGAKAMELEAELNKKLEARQKVRMPEMQKLQIAHVNKLKELMRSIDKLENSAPLDQRVKIFRARFFCEQGFWSELMDPQDPSSQPDETALLYKNNPNDLEARAIYGWSRLAIPWDEPQQGRPPRHQNPRPPAFEKAYAALGPLAKDEIKGVNGEPLFARDKARHDAVVLGFGVAACAVGKNAEAKAALDTIASIGSMRPCFTTIIGIPSDPDEAFAMWKDCARGLAANADDVALRKKRAALLFDARAFDLCIVDAQAVAKAQPDDLGTQLLLARALSGGNHFEASADAYKKAVELASKAEAPKTEAPKESQDGKKDGKETPAEKASEATNPDIVRAEYAMTLYCCDRMSEAKDAFSKIADPKKLGPGLQQAIAQCRPEDLIAAWADEEKARAEDAKKDDNPRVAIETDRGTVTIELFEDAAPNTVANFLYLGENGFYDGVTFHRVIAGFMAQGGDPTGTGAGRGPGWNIKDEAKENPRLHWRGTLSMAKTGAPDSGNSQFFITHEPTPHLNHRHTVFGRVIEGQSVVDSIQIGDVMKKFTVLRKRKHEYMPVKIRIEGAPEWTPKKDDAKKEEPKK